MKIGRSASLKDVAVRVGDALRRHEIEAVLTGGACAHVRSGGVYTSRDVDFVLIRVPPQRSLDAAMRSVGFERRGDHYEHPDLEFVVEFPPGPLAIGEDLSIRPTLMRQGKWATRALSPTDSCRDRLAAFYHWNDRQALAAAVAIALRYKVAMRTIREWSRSEGAEEGYGEFLEALRRAR